ncbi:MAG TPA: YqcI/YcgG family protein [Mycobacteriales bacterium]|jgi:hypothetical protein|nr:YqcI/YcgG family protein [Mycobacteriales bacterium]
MSSSNNTVRASSTGVDATTCEPLALGAIEPEHPLAPLAAPVVAALSGKDFPCTFVGLALTQGYLRFAHIDPSDPEYVAEAHRYISQYLRGVRGAAKCSQRVAVSIVLLLDIEVPADITAEGVRDIAWTLLAELHFYDRAVGNAWPMEVPMDMTDSRWAYCLEGTQLFINITSSTLALRRSRNLGRRLVMVIQPTDGLHYIAPMNAKGDKIRETIRCRIDSYDGLMRSPTLANFGDKGNRDANQFFLEDTNAPCVFAPPQIPAVVELFTEEA